MSGRKTILDPFKVMDAASMGADVTGPWTDVHGIDNVLYLIAFTGTPTGSFSVEACDFANASTPDTPVQVPVGLISATGSAAPAAAGAAAEIGIDINQIPGRYLRLKYARTAGTGSLTAIVSGKGV